MPPKLPNLKFKPKLVSQTKKSASDASTSELENLSAVQLERLHRQHEEHSKEHATTANAPAAQNDPNTASWTRSRTQQASTTAAGSSPADVAGGNAALGSSHGHTYGSSTVRKSAAAQLHEATGRYFDIGAYSEHAPVLPVNTINDLLGIDDGDEDDLEGQPRLIRPTPIAGQMEEDSAAVMAEADDPEEGGTAAPKDADTDGVAFLRAAEDEFQSACAANKRFYETKLAGAASSSPSDGHLTWMQLPRFHGQSPPFVLQDLPPGKVGELKVLRSGRVALEIAGVYYDVWFDGDGDGDDQSGARNGQGACSTVAVTQPSAHPMDFDSHACCYEVGVIESKMVCIPTVQEQK